MEDPKGSHNVRWNKSDGEPEPSSNHKLMRLQLRSPPPGFRPLTPHELDFLKALVKEMDFYPTTTKYDKKKEKEKKRKEKKKNQTDCLGSLGPDHRAPAASHQ